MTSYVLDACALVAVLKGENGAMEFIRVEFGYYSFTFYLPLYLPLCFGILVHECPDRETRIF